MIKIKINSGNLHSQLDQKLSQLSKSNVLSRLWEHDYTLWNDTPEEITNRLDWLTLPNTMAEKTTELTRFAEQVVNDGITTVILLGMGGSSLAPDVFQRVFGHQEKFPQLTVLDTTDAAKIAEIAGNLKIEHTLFIVSTKSGGTVETLSLFKYFYNLTLTTLGKEQTGNHFVAITDPGSNLETLASDLHFRKIFKNNPNLGGRYSALSYFGIVPGALLGMDIQEFLSKASILAEHNKNETNLAHNQAVKLGALLGLAANHRIDKITFLSAEEINSLEDWIEQLIAESTGKSEKGILPVVGESLASNLRDYQEDRIFAITRVSNTTFGKETAKTLIEKGFPVIEIELENLYQLGSLMLLWEIATAIAGHVMKIHPFNQPNVEAAKKLAQQTVETYKETGDLPKTESIPYSADSILEFCTAIPQKKYVAIQAFLTPTQKTKTAFRELQAALRDQYKLAVTFGFGPRYLHSTGQLHKGDGGNGYFLQFRSKSKEDIAIPEKAGSSNSFISFDILKFAQAIGDAQALQAERRKILAIDLDTNPLPQINDLISKIKSYG